MADNQHRVVMSAVGARGAVLGRPILILLLVSCVLAVVALASIYFDFFGANLSR